MHIHGQLNVKKIRKLLYLIFMNIHLSSRIETYVKYLSTDNQYLNDVKWICKSFMDDVKTSDNKWAKSKEISIAIEFFILIFYVTVMFIILL